MKNNHRVSENTERTKKGKNYKLKYIINTL
jgi:hypothetical protein